MNKNRKRLFLSALAVVGFALTGTVAAESWTTGYVEVPPHAKWGYSEEYNVKANESRWAGFYAVVLPNALGYSAKLVNSNYETRSYEVTPDVGKTVWADGNTGKPNYYYYEAVRSAWLEPNNSRVQMQFTAAYDSE